MDTIWLLQSNLLNFTSYLMGRLSANPTVTQQAARNVPPMIKQPLVGASVQQLRQVLQEYGSTGEVHKLIATVRAL